MKICGHNYKIVFVPHFKGADGTEYCGEIRYVERFIGIDSAMKKDVIEESLIHEILHGIIYHSNQRTNHNEQAIQAISNGLYQLGVGKYLLEKAKGGSQCRSFNLR